MEAIEVIVATAGVAVIKGDSYTPYKAFRAAYWPTPLSTNLLYFFVVASLAVISPSSFKS